MECPNCAEIAPPEAKWCEACGQDLNAEPLPTCVSCGEREVGEEGYCLSCGHKQPEERDHMVFEDRPAVAVTDRGKRHRHNEDAVAIGAIEGGATVLVVCDGVSTTAGSAEASLRAAAAARDLLVAGLRPSSIEASTVPVPADGPTVDPDPHPNGADRGAESGTTESPVSDSDSKTGAGDRFGADDPVDPLDTGELLRLAAEAAQAEAAAAAGPDRDLSEAARDGGPPSSTFVAVIVQPTDDGADVATAWVGDSRAYWTGDEPQQLSGRDHEIAGSLVRWLGADSLDPTPEIARTAVTGMGHVVVCSDGLWRYAAEPVELAELVRRLTGDGHHGVDLASAMVDFANEGGGHDNISVALWTNIDQPENHGSDQGDPGRKTDMQQGAQR